MQKFKIEESALELVQGDITVQHVDALVNAANSQLMGGGGVDGAIHRAGGPEIMAETNHRYPEGCPTGSAVISGAGELPAKYVIHAVGPIYSGGKRDEAARLATAYQRSLQLATQHGCQSIALPSLSTGAYRYPVEEAAQIALSTAIEHMRSNRLPELVRFVLFTDSVYDTFHAVLRDILADS